VAKRVPLTYAASGVDVGFRAQALKGLLDAVRYRPPADHGRRVDLPGHFAGLVEIGRETIAVTTDTVGSKVMLAEALDRWEEVGEDLVAVNVNDLAAVGARPAGLVDTILCPRPDPERFRALGVGVDRGLRAARCALLGGETAVVPGLVTGIDLGATAIGFFPRGRRPVTGERIRVGDVVIGLPSTGFHANGYTLLRRLLAEARVDLSRPRPGSRIPVGVELLRPTRTYTTFAEAIADRPEVHGFAHLSGGGVRNLSRLHPGVAFSLDRWPTVPPVFPWAQALGPISDHEMFQTFNMGIGFAIVAAARRVPDLLRRLARAGARDAVPIGTVRSGRGVRVPGFGLTYEGYA